MAIENEANLEELREHLAELRAKSRQKGIDLSRQIEELQNRLDMEIGRAHV